MNLPVETPEEPPSAGAKNGSRMPLLAGALFALIFLILLAAFGIFLLNRFTAVERTMERLAQRVEEATERSEQALDRAAEAESSALEAAQGRVRAEGQAASAEEEAENAQQEANSARQNAKLAEQEADSARREAALAREEMEKIRQEWESEVERLHDALNQIVDTRKTAFGLVMNLSDDLLKFDFDKATLRPENRELLSRIAGILLTSKNYSIDIYGHTDDVGSGEYNQGLSERRAQTVRDYLVDAGIDSNILTTQGFGKTRPLVPGASPEARAKNRRVEIGIVNTRIEYGRRTSRPQP